MKGINRSGVMHYDPSPRHLPFLCAWYDILPLIPRIHLSSLKASTNPKIGWAALTVRPPPIMLTSQGYRLRSLLVLPLLCLRPPAPATRSPQGRQHHAQRERVVTWARVANGSCAEGWDSAGNDPMRKIRSWNLRSRHGRRSRSQEQEGIPGLYPFINRWGIPRAGLARGNAQKADSQPKKQGWMDVTSISAVILHGSSSCVELPGRYCVRL